MQPGSAVDLPGLKLNSSTGQVNLGNTPDETFIAVLSCRSGGVGGAGVPGQTPSSSLVELMRQPGTQKLVGRRTQ